MAKKVVLYLVLCVLLFGYSTQSVPKAPLFSTFAGEQITPATVASLQPLMSRADLARIRAWIDSSKPILSELVKFEKPILRMPFTKDVLAENLGQQQEKINQVLLASGIPNKSKWNYIFAIPGTNYMAQIAGRIYRIYNLLYTNNLKFTTPVQEADKLITYMPQTYHTVSRSAGYLRAKEAVEKFHLNRITFPPTYIIGINENFPGNVNDDNSVIIQEKLAESNYVKDISRENKMRTISPEALRQIGIAIIYAGIWDIRQNLMIDSVNNNFVISDFEQYRDSNPDNFYMKNDADAIKFARQGLGELLGLFPDIPQLTKVCQKFNQLTDDEMKQIASGTLPASIATRLDEKTGQN